MMCVCAAFPCHLLEYIELTTLTAAKVERCSTRYHRSARADDRQLF